MSATVKAKAKVNQGYVPKAIPQTCSTCAHFTSDLFSRKSDWSGMTWVDEKNLRCGLGGFAVKKMGTCREFSRKPPP